MPRLKGLLYAVLVTADLSPKSVQCKIRDLRLSEDFE